MAIIVTPVGLFTADYANCLSVYFSMRPNLTEIDKRNKYLEIAGIKKIDFLLVIDSDEYAVIDMNEFSENLAKIKEYKTGAPVNGKTKDTPDVYGIKIFEKHIEKPDFIRERYIE
jgi:hypothetical protein